jgi:hypothetical protein
MPRDGGAVGAHEGVDLPLQRADHQRFGDAVAREQGRGAPPKREGRPLCRTTKGIGGRDRQADAAARDIDAMPLRDRFEKGALRGRGPARGAARDIGGIILGQEGRGDRHLDIRPRPLARGGEARLEIGFDVGIGGWGVGGRGFGGGGVGRRGVVGVRRGRFGRGEEIGQGPVLSSWRRDRSDMPERGL